MPKNAQTTAQLHSSHTLAKQCSKFFKSVFNSICELPDAQMDLEKAEETEVKLPTSVGSSKSERVPEKKKQKKKTKKKYLSALLTMPKPLTVWITINCGKFLKRWEYQTT